MRQPRKPDTTPFRPPGGDYTVTVTAVGFGDHHPGTRDSRRHGRGRPELYLKIGAAAEQLTITAAPPQLDTVDARMGQRYEMTCIVAAASHGQRSQDPTAFAMLMPGMPHNSGNYSFGDILGAQGMRGRITWKGCRSRPGQSGRGTEPPSGRLGGSYRAVPVGDRRRLGHAGRPGFNQLRAQIRHQQFHGSVYEYFRNTLLDARAFSDPSGRRSTRTSFGETLGGPVVKNRIFFFQSYDMFRYRQIAWRPSTRSRPWQPGRAISARTPKRSTIPNRRVVPVRSARGNSSRATSSPPAGYRPSPPTCSPSFRPHKPRRRKQLAGIGGVWLQHL